jgi:hypothetical protein
MSLPAVRCHDDPGCWQGHRDSFTVAPGPASQNSVGRADLVGRWLILVAGPGRTEPHRTRPDKMVSRRAIMKMQWSFSKNNPLLYLRRSFKKIKGDTYEFLFSSTVAEGSLFHDKSIKKS